MRTLFFVLMLALPAFAGEPVEIPWTANYPHNKAVQWDARKDTLDRANIVAGWTTNFKSGTPQEYGTVETSGTLSGILHKASDAATPFVVWMHGCTGLPGVVKEWTEELAKTLNAQGVGLLVLDSFTRRMAEPTCGKFDPHWGRRRADDAASALDYLLEKKLAKRDAVFVSGQSNGGLAALMAITERMLDRKHRFVAAIPMEPACHSIKREKFYAPIYFILAGEDDANKASLCLDIAKMRHKHPMQVTVIKGAHHGYMFKQARGVSKYGWQVGYNDVAKRLLLQRLSDFLKNPKVQPRTDYL